MLEKFSNHKYRWIALSFLAGALAIIIIDNTVLNVAIPYILRDLHTTLDAIQWVISGYALIIAALLITVGRIGDIWGRKKVFILGAFLFAVGSFIASIAPNAIILFIGEALIEAVGASMMMTSSLSLISTQFQGRERGIAFGIWGSIAGVAAAVGPLLGGFLTTYYSWRWSLRINVIVALIVILGSVFIAESHQHKSKGFDWVGTILSATGMFCLLFGFIEGRTYGWWGVTRQFSLAHISWPFPVSIIPFFFIAALILLGTFLLVEYRKETKSQSPLLKLSLFQNKGFSLGLVTLFITSLGQFGAFFVLPIYFQTVLSLTAFSSGIRTLPISILGFFAGSMVGVLASKIGPKWIVVAGMFCLAGGMFWLQASLTLTGNGWNLIPALTLLGIGITGSSSQLTNLVLSAAPAEYAGEASAVNSTMRQVGSSVGAAIIGTILATTVAANLAGHIQADSAIPQPLKPSVIQQTQHIDPESGQKGITGRNGISQAITTDINRSLVEASQKALQFPSVVLLLGALSALLIPNPGPTKRH